MCLCLHSPTAHLVLEGAQVVVGRGALHAAAQLRGPHASSRPPLVLALGGGIRRVEVVLIAAPAFGARAVPRVLLVALALLARASLPVHEELARSGCSAGVGARAHRGERACAGRRGTVQLRRWMPLSDISHNPWYRMATSEETP